MAGIKERLKAERARRPWLDHLLRAGSLYKDRNGDHMAAAVTYFSFLALFPMILVGFAVLGIVFAKNHSLIVDVQRQVKQSAPGGVGDQLSNAMKDASDHWRAVGVIGLLGALYAGLGWIGNLRTAIQEIWEYETEKEKFLVAKGRDLVALVGLGLAILVSLAITGVGTAGAKYLVGWVHLDDVPGMSAVSVVLGIVVAILADTIIFFWVFVRLPRSELTLRAVFRGTVFGAVGLEILKVIGSYYIGRVSQSPSAGVFGSVVGLLVFVNLVSRFLLFATAWTATSPSIRELHEAELARRRARRGLPAPAAAVPKVAGRPPRNPSQPRGGVVAAGLVGIGMVSGATISQVARHRLVRRR
ncbi:MAG TPA: inner membrane protein YhjD [Mycobacteriales bacterium]|nr:inner membrane protein YhjD [Mycobacteriales bacterium]